VTVHHICPPDLVDLNDLDLVQILQEASHTWLAILLFVMFVLLTYILMLNALIAMMSNTCSLVSENKVSPRSNIIVSLIDSTMHFKV
jgi:hypothetical protein